MATQGPLGPATTVNNTSVGSTAWSNPDNSQSSNDTYATVSLGVSGSNSNYLKATNFGFSLTSGVTIDGIVVSVERKGTGGVISDYRVKIVKGGVISGDDKASATTWPSSDASATYGTTSDLWGLTFTAEDINATDFGVAVACKQSGGFNTGSIDYISITVTYTAGSPTVTTQAVSSIASTTATGNGNVTSDGGAAITERGVCWNTTGTPTTADSTATSAGTTGAFTASMTSLSSGTLYYVRAYAINSTGTSYGSEVTFTTAGFTNPANAYSSNNTYTTVASADGDIDIQLSGDGGSTYSSVITKTFTGVEGSQTYGNGSTELWGLTWLGSNVSDANFRLKILAGTTSQIYKTFGFAPGASTILTGIEVSLEAKWDGATTSIDHVKVKIYYGTSTVPVDAGSIAYASDGNSGDGALALYDGTGNWVELGAAGGSGASTALNNLASVAINTSLISDTDNTDDLGSATKEWKDLYVDGVAYLDAIDLNGTALTSTATQLNYLSSATGTTGTTNTNIVFSTSPTLVTPALGTPASGVMTNVTGLPTAGLVDGAVTAAKLATAPSRFVAIEQVQVLSADPANTNYTDLDVTAQTSATAYAVCGVVSLTAGATARSAIIRKNGSSRVLETARSGIANATFKIAFIVDCDTGQIVEWAVNNADVTSLIIELTGYWETVA